MKIDDINEAKRMTIIDINLYGHKTRCLVLVIHPHGTIDVERLSDGKCFRVSGLPLTNEKEMAL